MAAIPQERQVPLLLVGLAILGKRVSSDRCMLLTVGGLALSLAGFYDAADRMTCPRMPAGQVPGASARRVPETASMPSGPAPAFTTG